MYFLLKMGIFHCYVSLPEGTVSFLRSKDQNLARFAIFHFQIQRVSLNLEMCLFALEGEFFVSIHGKKWMGSKVGAVGNSKVHLPDIF